MATDQEKHGVFERFLHSQVSGSMLLLAFTILALVWANSPWAESYFALEHTSIGVSWGEHEFEMSLGHWIGDGLMVIFFFVVGLEIKRELVVGELSTMDRALLPVTAAIGGMVVPALVYYAFNAGGEGARGWGVPMATDIAFALGILALFGSRVPIGLKVFLTALAIADDMGAVLVIAIFYTEQIVFAGVILAAVAMAGIVAASSARIRASWIYVLLFIVAWAGVLASGIHATVAGVLIALLMPVRGERDPGEFLVHMRERLDHLEGTGLTRESMIADKAQDRALEEMAIATDEMRPAGLALEKALHPVQAFLILPIFALFKAGIPLSGEVIDSFPSMVSLGVIAGLVLGKPIGVIGASWLLLRSGRATLPEGVTMRQVAGAGCLAGVGFTMSIFIGELAFPGSPLVNELKFAVLIASLTAGIIGYLALRKAF